MKMNFSSPCKNLLAHIPNDRTQNIRSDMRFCVIQDLLRRSVFDEGFQHGPDPSVRVFDQCIEFSVGKCSGSSLSELNIGIRLKHSGFPEFLHILLSFFHRSSPLDQDRTHPTLGQKIRAENPRRTASDYDRPFFQTAGALFGEMIPFFPADADI